MKAVKKMSAVLMLACASLVAFAQEEGMAAKGTCGLTFDLTGIAAVVMGANLDAVTGNPYIMGRHWISDDMAVRIGLGINSMSTKWSTVDSVDINSDLVFDGVTTMDSTEKSMDIYIAPGIEKHFASAGKIDPYLGLEIPIGIIGAKSMTGKTVFTPNTGTGTTIDVTHDIDGGFGFGVNLVAGFNYFFAKYIAIGAEYTWGFGSAAIGGDETRTIVTTSTPSVPTVNEVSTDKTTMSGLAVGSTFGVNLTVLIPSMK